MAIDVDSTGVQTYLNMMQNVITRMAMNSSNMKTWSVALVSAILVYVLDKQCSCVASIALLPVLIFMFLDAFYLSLERSYRDKYNQFVDKLHAGTANEADLFDMRPDQHGLSRFRLTIYCLKSASVWPFYLLLAVVIIIAYIIICLQSYTPS